MRIIFLFAILLCIKASHTIAQEVADEDELLTNYLESECHHATVNSSPWTVLKVNSTFEDEFHCDFVSELLHFFPGPESDQERHCNLNPDPTCRYEFSTGVLYQTVSLENLDLPESVLALLEMGNRVQVFASISVVSPSPWSGIRAAVILKFLDSIGQDLDYRQEEATSQPDDNLLSLTVGVPLGTTSIEFTFGAARYFDSNVIPVGFHSPILRFEAVPPPPQVLSVTPNAVGVAAEWIAFTSAYREPHALFLAVSTGYDIESDLLAFAQFDADKDGGSLGGLIPGTHYYLGLVARNFENSLMSNIMEFTTLDVSWSNAGWSVCSAICNGTQTLTYSCMDVNGMIYDEDVCLSMGIEYPSAESRSCNVVSDWSYSSCFCTGSSSMGFFTKTRESFNASMCDLEISEACFCNNLNESSASSSPVPIVAGVAGGLVVFFGLLKLVLSCNGRNQKNRPQSKSTVGLLSNGTSNTEASPSPLYAGVNTNSSDIYAVAGNSKNATYSTYVVPNASYDSPNDVRASVYSSPQDAAEKTVPLYSSPEGDHYAIVNKGKSSTEHNENGYIVLPKANDSATAESGYISLPL